ncbi:MAG: hypothetical protein P4L35_18215 [Ignavibacteriaceae bacterium]|nr:hypothetical protein [Ignavibacteriaceae bacterium]
MDNFIQYLFYFIIIAAFLNSIFGKKKKAGNKPVPQEPLPQTYNRDNDKQTESFGEDNFDITKEIENLFKKEIPVKSSAPIKIENVTTPETEVKRDLTEERAKEFEKQLNKREYSSDWFNKSIRIKLQKPESLKDYIIISEILGKPKAFE